VEGRPYKPQKVIPMEDQLTRAVKHWLSDISNFSRLIIQRPLRPYQLEPARAIMESILQGKGHTFVIMMCRQAGKNELSAQLEAYLLNLYQRRGGQIVKASPTYRPQTINSLIRLQDRLSNPWNTGRFRTRQGYMVELGNARALFFSASPAADVVGATADLLLEGDEAQDITEEKWYKDFTPMAASTNATRVLYGTAWTSNTLLARTARILQELERKDGIRRLFRYTADEVAQHVPAYAEHVKAEVERLGRNHPLIRTQYYLEEIDAESGMFPPQRRALMRGDHPRSHDPEPGKRYALLLDVAGEDETEGDALTRAMLKNPRRDATALTVVEVDTAPDRLPTYRTVDRKLWLGTKHTALYGQLTALANHWHATYLVVDATGVGAGLASFLTNTLGEKVIPFEFSTRTKSDLGWDYLGIVETGRYQDYIDDQAPDTRQFWYEVDACQYEIRPGPARTMRWGVAEPPAYDGLIARGHDDLLISASLCAVLDRLSWPGTGESATLPLADPLQDIDRSRW